MIPAFTAIRGTDGFSRENPASIVQQGSIYVDNRLVSPTVSEPNWSDEAYQDSIPARWLHYSSVSATKLTPLAATAESNPMRALRTAGVVIIFNLIVTDGAFEFVVPTNTASHVRFLGQLKSAEANKLFDPVKMASSASSMIAQIRDRSALTLEQIAPLLGVSRRTIQSWKAGKEISNRNEEKLRELAEAVQKLSLSNPRKTRDLLLERIPGITRIYDLLAVRKFDEAIARAKSSEKPQPIHSDQSIVFHHLPIGSQLAVVEDEQPESPAKLNRKVSRRLKL